MVSLRLYGGLFAVAVGIVFVFPLILSEIKKKQPSNGVSVRKNHLGFDDDPRPRGLRLLMIGDSVTRYHYLSLTHFLLHGKWIDQSREEAMLSAFRGALVDVSLSNPMKRLSYPGDWNDFFQATTRKGYEICDCCRIESNMTEASENRYFYDPSLDNMVAMIQIMQYPQGREDPSNITLQRISNYSYNYEQGKCKKLSWRYREFDGFADVIRHVARKLPLAPTYALMNRGLWPGDWFVHNDTRRVDLLKALLGDAANRKIVGIWRTTTSVLGKKENDTVDNDDTIMKAYFLKHRQLALDASWTKHVHTTQYWDDRHFWEPTYRVLSEDLLRLLGHHFPSGYTKLDRTSLFGPTKP